MTAEVQPELQLKTPAPLTTAAEQDELVALLRGRGWMTMREIASEHPGWSDRHIRAIASESGGRIVSGQHGYKLTLECTPEEVHHATAWLRSQARVMTDRAIAIARLFHEAANRGTAA